MRAITATAGGVLLAVLGVLAYRVTLGRADTAAPSPLGGDLAQARGDRHGLRVLFLGNSLTYENDMPDLFERLVASEPSNDPLFAVEYTPPGQTLAKDTDNSTVSDLLREVHWDYVVLQEGTPITTLDADAGWRAMVGPVQELASRIRAIGATPLLFDTWGDRTGGPFNPYGSYAEMQEVVTSNYLEVAARLSIPPVPVGPAWSDALKRRPGVPLWEADGHHPSLLGAYLDAAVFYAYLYRNDPLSDFLGGLPRGEARFLQQVAHDAV